MSAAVLDRPKLDRDSAGNLLGSEQPRLWTPPLRVLTPETSLGFEAIRFAERVLLLRLLPWQKWWLIHALELNLDGSFRFRIFLTLIARQNGKTFLLMVVSLFFLYVQRIDLVLGVAQDLRIARESWDGAYNLAAAVPALAGEFVVNSRTRPGRRDGAGYEAMVLHRDYPCRECDGRTKQCEPREYRVSAATKSAGRGLTVDLLLMDEFRHATQLAWAALSKTTTAKPNALILPISNAGDDESEVLNGMREAALAGLDESIGIAEWSGPDGCALDDETANALANPALGHGLLTHRTLATFRAVDSPEVYRTESLCQRVAALDVVISAEAWKMNRDEALTLDPVRARVAAVFEVSPDGAHATLIAAGRFDDGKIGVDVVYSWKDPRRVPAELPDLVAKIKPAQFGWFPGSPGASQFAPLLRGLPKSVEIKGGDVTEACQALVGIINRGGLRQGMDPLLTAQAIGARKLEVSDGFRFVRKGSGHVDAVYAMAGAVRLASNIKVAKTSGVWIV
jgi:hypothetical protein